METEKPTPLVSILIPVFNREELIEATIRSALGQTYSNIEVVVVDNASTDRTYEVLIDLAATESRLRIFRNSENIGPVRNWERCIAEARGQFGKILWSDDLIEPAFVQSCVSPLSDPDIGFVFTEALEFQDGTGKVLRSRYKIGKSGVYSSNYFIRESLLFGDVPYSPGCAMFRLCDLREVLEVDVPNYLHADYASLAIGNDVLIFLNVAARYQSFYFVDEPLSLFRNHAGSITYQSSDRQLYYCAAKSYFAERHSLAVSYTHLTLPTIYSV